MSKTFSIDKWSYYRNAGIMIILLIAIFILLNSLIKLELFFSIFICFIILVIGLSNLLFEKLVYKLDIDLDKKTIRIYYYHLYANRDSSEIFKIEKISSRYFIIWGGKGSYHFCLEINCEGNKYQFHQGNNSWSKNTIDEIIQFLKENNVITLRNK